MAAAVGVIPTTDRDSNNAPVMALAAIMAVTYLVYLPGLTGSFLFDDWSNLAIIGQQGRIGSWKDLVTYLLSGFSGPLGRPLPMASFLLDAQTWPADPARFKHTNLLIHLLNGALLCALVLRLCEALGAGTSRAARIAVVASGLWLLHPLFVSTTLYVVQRMTMLATTFSLAALFAYLQGRRLLTKDCRGLAYLWLYAGVAGLGVAAVLSKENAALLPLMILVIEHLGRSAMEPIPPSPGWQLWRWLYLYLPASLLCVFLAHHLLAIFGDSVSAQGITPLQHLLTEPRIILMYLADLFLPRPSTSGLFYDGITPSSSLLNPSTTLTCILAILGLAWLTLRVRKAFPAFSVSLGFFLVGHILESTVLPLELAFEHRNYLPAALLFLPIAWTLSSPPWSTRRLSIVTLLLAFLAVQTGLRADLWGTPFQQALTWAHTASKSSRAKILLADRWLETGNLSEAERLIHTAVMDRPRDIATRVSLLRIKCRLDKVPTSELHTLTDIFRTTRLDSPVVRYQLEQALNLLESGGCRSVGPDAANLLIAAGLGNRHGPGSVYWRRMLLYHRARVLLDRGEPTPAYADIRSALIAAPEQGATLAGASLLANAGQIALALQLLDDAPVPRPEFRLNLASLKELWLVRTGYYERELRHLRQRLLADLKSAHEHHSHQAIYHSPGRITENDRRSSQMQ